MEHLIEKTADGQFRVVLFSSKHDPKDNLLSMEEIRELTDRLATKTIPGVSQRPREPGVRLVIPGQPTAECAKLAGTQLVTGSGDVVKVYGILEPHGFARFPFTKLVDEKKATLYGYRGVPSHSVRLWCVAPLGWLDD